MLMCPREPGLYSWTELELARIVSEQYPVDIMKQDRCGCHRPPPGSNHKAEAHRGQMESHFSHSRPAVLRCRRWWYDLDGHNRKYTEVGTLCSLPAITDDRAA